MNKWINFLLLPVAVSCISISTVTTLSACNKGGGNGNNDYTHKVNWNPDICPYGGQINASLLWGDEHSDPIKVTTCISDTPDIIVEQILYGNVVISIPHETHNVAHMKVTFTCDSKPGKECTASDVCINGYAPD